MTVTERRYSAVAINGYVHSLRFLRDAKIDIVAVDEDLAARAMSGWRRYGKGRHRAALNFGDCFRYALAGRTGHPVLCTGDDFTATGISVLRPPAGNGRP
jgi:ribonuclease VapC